MNASERAMIQINDLIQNRLTKVGEIRTYEVWYECKKARLDLDYKAVGEALRRIMDKMICENRAVKSKLGVWKIFHPIEGLNNFNSHPIDDSKEYSDKVSKTCEEVRLKLGKNPETWQILDACTDAGITTATFIDYMNKRRKVKNENNSTVSKA